MKNFNSLQIVTNSNGIVRIYGDGAMIFEVQCNYLQVETKVDCGKIAASGTIPELKEPLNTLLNQKESWPIGKSFSTKINETFGVFKCVDYCHVFGYLMVGESEDFFKQEHYASALDITRTHFEVKEFPTYWECVDSLEIPRKTPFKIQKPTALSGRIMLDESDFEPMSDEEIRRRENWDLQPESQYLK